MEILLASNNAHKKEELQEILQPFKVITPSDKGIEFDCEETGTTYLDNALLKANTLFDLVQMPVISDDSGLSVPALHGAPGVYSARFGSDVYGRMLESPERNAYLLKQMEQLENREAFFVCSMVLLINPYRIYSVQETLQGEISRSPAGSGGFGYDPVFYLKEHQCSLAEVSSEVKNRISHRGKAGKEMAAILKRLQF